MTLANQEAISTAVISMLEGSVDLAPLQEYENLKRELVSIDITSGPSYMQNFLAAYEKTAKMLIKVRKQLDDAKDEARHQEAKAKLERFTAYFEANKATMGALKDSASLRDVYLDLDPEFRAAKEKVNALSALNSYLENKMESFRMAHDDSKKIYDKLATGPFGKNGYGGMSSGGRIGDEE